MTQPHRIQADQTALLIVDIQEKLFALMDQREKVTRNVITLITAAKTLGLPILLTEQYRKGLGPTVSPIAEALDGGEPMEKLTFSCMANSQIRSAVEALGRTNLIVTGIETHICVQQTILDLAAAGVTPCLPIDATCSRRKHDWQIGIERMRTAGAVLATTESIVFELLGRAGTDAFKTLLPRFK